MDIRTPLLALALTFTLSILSAANAQELPSGYKLLYEQDFQSRKSLEDFEMTDPQAWQLGEGKTGKALELHAKSVYEPIVRSPLNIAIIKDKKFGSFILEADLLQSGKEYGHRDLCLFLG